MAIQTNARFHDTLDCRVGLRPPRNDDVVSHACLILVCRRCGIEDVGGRETVSSLVPEDRGSARILARLGVGLAVVEPTGAPGAMSGP